MKRREFIMGLAGAAATPFASSAQERVKRPRVGFLMHLTPGDPDAMARVAAFLQGLQELGWATDRNIQIDYRWAAGQDELYRKYALELVALKPDVLVTTVTDTVRALQRATRTIPIVFTSVIDPVGSGLITSLSHPGGNATGFSLFEFGISGKWLELLKQIVPSITRVAVLIPTRRLGDSRDSRIGSGVIQDGKRRVFAMGQAVPVRTDYTAGEVRRFARRAKDGAQARRLLALAAVLDGASREEAAKIGGMDRQTLRDWVIRYNEQGPDGLINIPSPGAPPKLDDTHKAFLRRIVEEGPIPAIHGVVRWRACDLIVRLHDEFGLSVSDDTIYRALKDLGFSHVSARPKAYKQDADAMAAFKKTLPYAWRKSARHSRLARQ